MKKRTKLIFSAFLAIFLILAASAYAYVSDYYPADEAALTAMAHQTTDQVQIEQDGDVIWFVPEEPTAGLIFTPAAKWNTPLTRPCCVPARNRGSSVY